MKEFSQSTGFIVAFLVGTIFIQMTTNDRITTGFLWLVLLSMLTVNADKFKTLMDGVNKL